MFERFTERARRVVVLAQEEARLLDHNWIGTEHLLLGLLHEGEGVAARALTALGVDLAGARAEVEEVIGRGGEVPTGHIPFTPRAKKVLELSLREALNLGHNYIGTEHILVGLVREGEGVAAQVLQRKGVTLTRVRQEVSGIIGTSASAKTRGAPPAPPAASAFTPAGEAAMEEARRLAGGRPIGSHHLLQALWNQDEGLAHRALTGLGVDGGALAERVKGLDPSGTADELPDEAGARRTSIRVIGDKVAVLLDDAALRERLAGAMGRVGRDLLTRAADPGGSVFPRLWRSVHDAVGEVVRRVEGEGGPPADWRPPEWPDNPDVAAYAVVAGTNLHSVLELAEGVDAEAVRSGLAGWLSAHQHRGPGASTECSYLSVVVGRAGDAEEWGQVSGLSHEVVEGWPTRPLDVLLAHAIVDLTSTDPPRGEGSPGEPPPASTGLA